MMSLMDAALMSKVFGAVAAAMWLVSAGLWAYSASRPIRNNIDVIVGDLQRVAYWNGGAAITACIAAIASFVVVLCEQLR
jgi:hypothetical protein